MCSTFLGPGESGPWARLGWRKARAGDRAAVYTSSCVTCRRVWIWPHSTPPKIPAVFYIGTM